MLKVGQKIPNIKLIADDNSLFNMELWRNANQDHFIILYFYPKDDTTGCTAEACAFRDSFPRFKKSKALILGISPDSAKKHAKFKAKYELPFTLLVDEDHKLAESYGLWIEKVFYGRKYMGIARTTIVVGPDGKIQHIFEKVNPAGHADEVMAFLTGGIVALEKLKPAPVEKKKVKAPAKKKTGAKAAQ